LANPLPFNMPPFNHAVRIDLNTRMRDTTAKQLSRIHRLAFQASKGRIGRRLVDNDMLLLTTTGRRSGRPHTVPLLYLSDGTDVMVVASWGGRDYPPDWYLNLLAEPMVSVQVDGSRIEAQAQVLEPPDRTDWWQRFVTAYEGYRAYQTRTDRVIPIVRLARDRGATLEPGKEMPHGTT
jgi:deazaflavin-dependent oxidoreductase (nitroreductase family)